MAARVSQATCLRASGRRSASSDGTPLCNLYVSMLERMGCPVQSFGDSTEAMPIG